MSERPAKEEYSESPERAGTPADTWPTREYNFGLQTIMEMQKTLGGLTEAVNGLKTSVEGQGKSIDRIKIAVYVATGAFLVLAPLATYLLDKKFDAIIGSLSK